MTTPTEMAQKYRKAIETEMSLRTYERENGPRVRRWSLDGGWDHQHPKLFFRLRDNTMPNGSEGSIVPCGILIKSESVPEVMKEVRDLLDRIPEGTTTACTAPGGG